MPNRTVVEFIGIPGSGKSTLAKAIYDKILLTRPVSFPGRNQYRQKHLTFFDKLRIDTRYLKTLLSYRFRRIVYDSHYYGFGLDSIRRGWGRSRYPGIFFDTAKDMNESLIILDEWLVHRTIDEDVRFYQAGFDYVGKFYLPPLTHVGNIFFVLVKIDSEIALQRILHDKQPHRHFARIKDEILIRQVLTHWEQDIKEVCAALETKKIPLIMINGSDPIEQNAELLANSLRQKLEQ